MPTRQELAAETATTLKDAARRVFARQGYLNTKIVDITREAGRAAGSFYNHFADKEALLESLMADMLAEADESVPDPEHGRDFNDRAAIRWHVAVFWAFYRAHRPVLVAVREAATVDPRFKDRLDALLAADAGHMRAHLASVRHLPGPPHLVVSAMNALLEQFAYTWLAAGGDGSGEPPTDEQAIDLLTDLLHTGIAGRGRPPRT